MSVYTIQVLLVAFKHQSFDGILHINALCVSTLGQIGNITGMHINKLCTYVEWSLFTVTSVTQLSTLITSVVPLFFTLHFVHK